VAPEALDSLSSEPWARAATFVTSPLRSASKPRRVAAEMTWLPLRLRRDRVDLLHSLGTTTPPLCPVPSVVTVLDLIYHHFPETFPRASGLGLRALVPAGARRADRVIAISHAGKRDLVETLGLDPGKVDVVHLGFGMSPAPDPVTEATLRERYRLGDAPIVLTISAALRHKNLDRLISAFAKLASGRDVRLVVAGHGGLEQDALRAAAQARGVGDQVVFTGWVDDAVVEGLYAAASVFAYPSLLEGFGLPILEAMRRDVPVACSNLSALPEIAGDAAELFDPHDVDAIACSIARLLDDEARRAELVARGRRRWTEFTWERAASATLDVYRRVLEARNRPRTAAQ
jgi:glycosyltransferase involved in cell wall biosynthesis